ncbi:MAG: PQQ-like beta-propeller repeat protein [Planctomycetes bacterium]|nr:PQQ-like beta-propeller repeat protein [Planctomycetota bacterium]
MSVRLSLASVLAATLLLSADGHAGDWTQFRGPHRDGISDATGLLHTWPAAGPKVLWSVEACQGYAGAAIQGERVFFNDYDRESNQWLVRCLALADGKELWRFHEERRIRPNHGITRTVPAVDDERVFSLDPKCTFHALDAATGNELWRKNLVEEYGTAIPPWYNGQCPLIEDDRVLIATGGNAIVVALEKASGKELWRTPNPEGFLMSHSSLMPAELGGVKQYLYATLQGLHGIGAEDGKALWFFPFKFNVAVAPSPLVVDGERVFITAGYDAGSAMVRVRKTDEGFAPELVFSLTTNQWNSEVHTPILYQDHIFAVGKKRRGQFTCLDLDGKIVWTSDASFGLGSYMLADGMFLLIDGDSGMLRLAEASTEGYHELASAQVLEGNDVWAPPALASGKLIVRDMTHMVCLDIAAQQ